MRALNGRNIIQVKSHNRQAILLQLLRAPLSRVELANRLHLSSTTVTNLINELLHEGWVIPDEGEGESNFHQSGRGRPRTRITLDAQVGYVLAVHMGIGAYWIAQVDLVGTLIDTVGATFDTNEAADIVITKIAHDIQSLIATNSLSLSRILGIGFGASGLVDVTQGVNVYAPSLGWQDVPVADLLQTQTGLPVVVENNVRAMALGEAYFGQGRDVESLAFIFGRIGIGAGLVMNGRIQRGMRGGAGEIGHTMMMPTGGKLCRCGQVGCLETLVTQPALFEALSSLEMVTEMLAEEENPVTQFEHILQLARDGETAVMQVIHQVAHYLGIALTNLVNTLNPQRIVMGGMYAQGADIFLPLLRQQVAQSAFGHLGEDVQIEAATFGLDAGLVGAASVALVTLFYEANVLPVEVQV